MKTLTPRQISNRIKKQELEIEAHKKQKKVKEIQINIEWKKSRIWGYCPRAEARIYFKDGSFELRDGYYASGCGYDKESTVIADIFNDFLKYKLYQKRKLESSINGEKVDHPYGVYHYYYGGGTSKTSNSSEWHLSKPYFNGGIGTSCYYKIAEFIGGKFENVTNGKNFRVFKYTDNI